MHMAPADHAIQRCEGEYTGEVGGMEASLPALFHLLTQSVIKQDVYPLGNHA